MSINTISINNSLISEALSRARHLGKQIIKAHDTIFRVAEELLKQGFYRADIYNGINNIEAFIYGIDSSMGYISRVGGFLLVPLRAAMVILRGIYRDEYFVITEKNFMESVKIPREIHDGLSPGVAKNVAEYVMLGMENDFLKKIVGENRGVSTTVEKIIYIDGPIIDPPGRRYVEEEFERHYNERANSIAELAEKGFHVIGFVKRIMGDSLVRKIPMLAEELREADPALLNDWTFTTISLYYVMYKLLRKGIKKPAFAYTYPLELGDPNYARFLEAGVKVYSTFYIMSIDNRLYGPYRIDFALPENVSEEKVLSEAASILRYTLPLQRGLRYPLPIILAHNRAHIDKNTGYLVLKAVLSKGLYEAVKNRVDILRTYLLLLQGEK